MKRKIKMVYCPFGGSFFVGSDTNKGGCRYVSAARSIERKPDLKNFLCGPLFSVL